MQAPARRVMSVLGILDPADLGITNAHDHAWIEPVTGTDPGAPVLDDLRSSVEELRRFRAAGGGALVDCQPGGCGRNGTALREIARDSGVKIIACTGFHLRKYYPPGSPVWTWNADQAAGHFTAELVSGLEETLDQEAPVRAGFIKIACETTLEKSPRPLLEGAADASLRTGSAVEIHTEKGLEVENILEFFLARGVSADRLVLCHVDKRPDFGLHRELVQAGALLEYDTFFRPKYAPEKHVWPLLERMAAQGLDLGVALAADLADPAAWAVNGGEFGLAGLVTQVLPRLKNFGISDQAAARLMGENIALRLARRIET